MLKSTATRFRLVTPLVIIAALAISPANAQESGGPSTLATKLTRLRAAKEAHGDAVGPAHNPTYDRMLKSVGLIQLTFEDATYSGTGWVVDADKRLLVTNHHVIEGGLDCDVYFPKYSDGVLDTDPDTALDESEAHYARVIDSDETLDLALIQLEDKLPEGIVALELADQSAPPGSRIHSLAGSTVGSQSLWIYSTGHVRQIVHGELANGYETRLLESDMATNQGNSGGPVCNDQGQVVAVVEGHCTDARLVSIYVDLHALADYLSEGLRAVDPQTPEDLSWSAERHLDEGRAQTALELINKAIAKTEPDADLLAIRGWCWYSLDDNDNAAADFNEAIQIKPHFADAHYGLGCLADEAGEYKKAIQHFTDAIRNEPGVAYYLVDRGAARRALGQHEKAKRDIESALEIDPEDFDGLCELVFVETDLGNHDAALETLGTIIEDVMDYDQAMFYAGFLMQAKGEFEPATRYFTRTLELDPEYTWANYYLGCSLNELHQFSAATQYFEIEKQRHPEDEDVAFQYAIALVGSERIDEGIVEVQRARELAPDTEAIERFYRRLREEFGDHFDSEQ